MAIGTYTPPPCKSLHKFFFQFFFQFFFHFFFHFRCILLQISHKKCFFISISSSDIFSCILNNHISDHQPIVLFSNDDLPPTKHKYITIKSNTDEAKALFCTSFENKYIIYQCDTNIHNTDPNHNYEILERSLTETQSECFLDRVVMFNYKKHKKLLGLLKE